MATRKKTYFASDFHLGVDARVSSAERERQLVRWLSHVESGADAIYLVGDIFEFWYTYRHVVPKGYVRLLGKLAELSDGGLPIHCFTGNHDMWLFDYLSEEVGLIMHTRPQRLQIQGKAFLIGHGDGLGPGDRGYKRLKRLFSHPTAQWFFERLHPNFGISLAYYWSHRSRTANPGPTRFYGIDREWLIAYAERKLAQDPAIDFFVFGHRHLPIDHLLSNDRSRYINLGEWLHFNSYAVFDGEHMEIEFFETPPGKVFGRKSLSTK